MSERIGVLMGGWGEEKEISMKTGEAVAGALERLGHHVQRILAGPGLDRTVRASPGGELAIDLAFIALHGRMGEDGRVQGLLETMRVPYTGSGVLASALAMNKVMAKRLFRLNNLPTAPGYSVRAADAHRAPELHGDLGFPCIVKPACGGSSVGIQLVRAKEALVAAVREAARFGGEALVERQIRGREVTVGIVGEQVLGSCEVAFAAETFDFERKYRGGTRYHLPPRLGPTRLANVEALALGAYRALGCRGYARVDLIASEHDNDVLLEVNTLPGMTPTSLLPKIAAHAQLPFEALVDRIVSLASLDEAEPQAAEMRVSAPSAPARRAG
jgi:D-alanine-D-alanine ligase